MARSVADVALFLSVLATADSHSPTALADDPSRFAGRLDRDFKGTRIAWYKDLGGIPFEPEIRRVVGETRHVFESLGCVVEEAEPDFAGVDEAFPTLRHLSYHSSYAALAKQRPDWIKDTIHWEIDEAERQTAADVARASARQDQLYVQVEAFFSRYDYFVLPVTQTFFALDPPPLTVWLASIGIAALTWTLARFFVPEERPVGTRWRAEGDER